MRKHYLGNGAFLTTHFTKAELFRMKAHDHFESLSIVSGDGYARVLEMVPRQGRRERGVH